MKKLFQLIKPLVLFIAISSLCGCSPKEDNSLSYTPVEEVNSQITSINDSDEVLLNLGEDVKEDIKANLPLYDNRIKPAITQEIASMAFSLVTIDLMAIGYRVFAVKEMAPNGVEGIAYTGYQLSSYSPLYKNIDGVNKEYKRNYVYGGFIDYRIVLNDTPHHAEETERIFYAKDYKWVDDEYYFLDNYRNIVDIKGHFIMDKAYIKYQLIGDSLYLDSYYILRDGLEPYDLSLGSLYNYDIEDYIYIPLKEIETYHNAIPKSITRYDSNSIQNCITKIKESQNNAGYIETLNYVIFLSTDTYNMLNGTVSQSNTLNGIAVEAINNIDYDPNEGYLTLNPDCSITYTSYPVLPKNKTTLEWVADALFIGGGTLLAIVISVSTAGAGCYLSEAILGAVGEYTTQAIFCGKSISEVNWGKVAVGSIFGALNGGIPCADSILGYFGNLLVSGSLGAAKEIAIDLMDGEKDSSVLLKDAIGGAAFNMTLYTLKNVMFENKYEVELVDPDNPIPGDPSKISFKPGDVVDDSPFMALEKNFDSLKNISDDIRDMSKNLGNVINGSVNNSSNVMAYSAKSVFDFVEFGL